MKLGAIINDHEKIRKTYQSSRMNPFFAEIYTFFSNYASFPEIDCYVF